MTAEHLIKTGDLEGALAALQADIRATPSDAKLRIFLFQLLCVTGDWTRAIQQLKTSATLDPSAEVMAQTYRAALICERHRASVFSGELAPVFMDEPPKWLTVLWNALQKEIAGDADGAASLRDEAMQAADPTAGHLNSTAFQWIADADPRFGPVLEIFLNGQYVWLPFADIHKIDAEPPCDLRDLVWTPVTLELTNGSAHVGLIPTRYPGTDINGAPEHKLARATDWTPGGLGQRILCTDTEELALLDVRQLTLAAAPQVAQNG